MANDLRTRLTMDGSDFNAGMDKSTKKVEEFQRQSKKAGNEVKDFTDKATLSTKDLLKEMGKISGAERSMSGYSKKLSQMQKDIQDLTVNYRAMNEEMRNSDVGRAAFTRIQELTKEAANYKDAVIDARAAVNTLASDTAAWDAAKQGISALSGALQGVVSTGILGKNSTEDLVAVIAKLKGIEATTNAVIQVGNALQKESALMMGVAKIQSLALAKAKALETTATKGATIAQKAFNVVAKANPYVLLASAVLAVGTALFAFTKRSKEATDAISDTGDATSRVAGFQEKYNKALGDAQKSSVSTVAKFSLLQAQYKNLRTEGEKQQWIKDNKKNLDDLNLSIGDVNDADNIFIKNAEKVIQAMKLRAEVSAMMATYEEQYKDAYEKSLKAQEERANAFSAGGTIKKEWRAAGLKVGEDIKQSVMTMPGGNTGAVTTSTFTLTPAGEAKLREYYKSLGKEVMDNFTDAMDPVIQEMQDKMALASKLEAETGAFKTNDSTTTTKGGGKKGGGEKEYKSQLEQLKKQLQTLEEQKKDIIEGTDEWKKQLEAIEKIKKEIENLEAAEKGYIERLRQESLGALAPIQRPQSFIGKAEAPKPKTKDELVEQYQEAKKLADKYKEYFDLGLIGRAQAQSMIDGLNKQLAAAGITAKVSLDLEVEEDKLEDQLSGLESTIEKMNTIGDVASGVVGSMNSIYEAFANLNDKLEDAQNGWESFFAIFQTGMQILDGAVGIITAINTIMGILNATKQKQASITQQETATTMANTAAEGANTAAKISSAAASGALASGEAASSVASVPFVGPILAVAAVATVMAAIIAMLASLKGFADGGIVGGNSRTGDKILARLNSGELVLNDEQQNKLWNMINGTSNSGSMSGDVRFVLEGDQLVGLIENHTKIQSKI